MSNLHIAWVLANNSSAPYFTWFAERAAKDVGIKFSFICLFPSKPQMIEDVKKFGWECYWLKFDHHKRKRGFIKLVPQLYLLFKKIRPDIVHTHLFDDALPALMAARLSKVKIRVNTKADTSYHYYHHPQYFIFDKFNNFNSTHLVAISEESKIFILDKEKENPQKITLIHHGIPIEKLTLQSEESRKKLMDRFDLKGKIVLGTISRFIEWKGYRYILSAAETVVKLHPNCVFLFVGQGEQELELRELAKSKQLTKNIIFTGWVNREDVPSLYGLMDIYIHAASKEPFGFVIAEAMANGVPLVSTKTGAAGDAIEHLKNGYLVCEKNATEIAEGIFYLLANDRKKIGLSGKESAMKLYNFEKMYSGHMQLYKKAYLNVHGNK